MLTASLYIIVCSARNRLRVRLRRLREPRYLFGAIAGLAYFYFAIFSRMGRPRAGRSSRQNTPARTAAVMAALQSAGTGIAAMAVLVVAALSWLLPTGSGLLDFTEAEINFLMTAPVTRRQLLVHRMMRSQLGLLFTSIISAIAFPSVSGLWRVRFAVALWLLLVTGKVYFTGVTLARARLASSNGGVRRVAWAPLTVLLLAIGVVMLSAYRVFGSQAVTGPADFFTRLGAVSTSGLAPVVLWPFMALVRPLFAPWPGPFLLALVPSIAVLALTVAWVLHTDEAFEEAAAEASERQAAARAARSQPAPTVRAAGWVLPLTGAAEGVFLWKNAMQFLRATTGLALLRFLIPLTAAAVVIVTAMMSAKGAQGMATLLCTIAIGAAAFTVVLGPQIVRIDLRDDLRHLELLKTWPIRPAAVIRGEMLCPGLLITLAAWLAIACAGIFSAAAFPDWPLGTRVSIALAAATLAPPLVFAQLLVHNAAAVLFPAWIPLGSSRPRGLDAMGQRLIMLAGVLLVLILMMAPGILAGAVLWFVSRGFVGEAALVPAAMLCLVIVAVELMAGTEALAPAYERMDALSIERSE